MGFGNMATYHGNNEYCEISKMHDGFDIMAKILSKFDE